MDKKVHVHLLWEYSEHLGKVATRLSAKLKEVEQALNEHPNSPAPNPALPFTELAQIEKTLAVEAERLSQRLHVFLESNLPRPESAENKGTE
jgi:hypothetical protein